MEAECEGLSLPSSLLRLKANSRYVQKEFKPRNHILQLDLQSLIAQFTVRMSNKRIGLSCADEWGKLQLMMILIMILDVSIMMMILKPGSDESTVLPVACDDDDDDDDVVGVCLLAHGFVWMMGTVVDLFIIVVGSGWSRKKTCGLFRFGCRD
jgi:hypothetical protein